MRPRIALAAALLLAAGCGDATDPGTTAALGLLQARARWEEREPLGYTFEYHETCFCAPTDGEVQYDLRVEVVEGQMASVAPLDPSGQVPLFPAIPEAPYYPITAEGLFNRLEAALRDGADGLEVEYDPTYGFPRRAIVDFDRELPGDGFQFELRDFREIPVIRVGL